MSFIDSVKEKAKSCVKTIVLPEAEDKRVVTAAAKVLEEGFAKIILLGEKNKIENIAKESSLDISKAIIINPIESPK